jgi:hypothetical protein
LHAGTAVLNALDVARLDDLEIDSFRLGSCELA